ncbi:protein CD300H-like isoform X1 [Diceros bicornis minor]|uniref:protein CD300H-like isoform X1 n=1 Tax=Diceros bicornis minor TaxID=77932 RepID=UPI0026F2082F|nr:protein CD300H-like isoform X1 [Diceros bicornis minor]XP_058417495.1 protein CD300H-like isoform X1 [Diceros bicornis minor]
MKSRRGRQGERTLGEEAPASGPATAGETAQRDGAMWLPSAVLLLCVPGSLSLSGPSNVTGTVGGSLSVQCRYEEEYRTFTKYWCRQPCLPLWQQIVETTESETEVRRGRVSIMDHTEDLTFTVTLENLTADDTGKYRCGIATILREEGLQGFLPDPFFQVQVFVFPASSSKSSTWTPGCSSQQQGSLLSSVHFLLLISLKVPLLLIMLSAVLWVNRPQRVICGETEPA